MTETVVLAVGLATYTLEMVTVNNTLEAFTFGSTDDIHKCALFENVGESDGVAELEFSLEVCREFDKLALRSGSCLCKMPFERGAGMFL